MLKLVLVVALVGCGGSGMGGLGGDDEPPTDGADRPPPEKDGWVSLSRMHGKTGPDGTLYDASFVGADFRSKDTGCTATQIGACTVSRCVAPPSAARSAGTITVTGLTSSVTLVPSGDKMYEPFLAGASLFGNGEVATVRGTGADVTAFTGTVITPRLATFTGASASMTELSRSTPLEVTWTGGSGDVLVTLNGTSGSGVGISCRYPAVTGSATVGADVLSQLSQGFGQFDFSTIADGDAGHVGVTAYFGGVRTDQAFASGNIAIQ